MIGQAVALPVEKNDVAGFTRKLAEISESLWEQRDVIVDDITAVVVFY